MQRRARKGASAITPTKIMVGLAGLFLVVLTVQLLRVVVVEPRGPERHEREEVRVAPLQREDSAALHYGIMGDLGSSGSRVYVYKWMRRTGVEEAKRCRIGDDGEFFEVDLIDNWESYVGERERNEKKPGISSLLKKKPTHTVDELIGPILEYAKQFVPLELQAETPIYFFATAGLRTAAEDAGEKIFDDDDFDGDFMLEEDDDQFSSGDIRPMLQSIRDFVRSHSRFILKDNHVKILDGSEEALYDWLSLQMFLRNGYTTMLKNDTRPIEAGEPVRGAYQMGLIDCGGASVQIAYPPSEPTLGDVPLDVFSDSSRMRVAAKSYLGYGMYSARARHETKLAEAVAARGGSTVYNPCILRNNTQHVRYNGFNYEMPGGGDYEACYKTIWDIFSWGSCGGLEGCRLEGRELESWSRDTKFLAIDNAYRTGKFFNCGGYCTLRQLRRNVMDFCYTEFTQALKKYSHGTEFRIRRYCFEGTYLTILLEKGFGFPLDEPVVGFSDYVGGTHINWALGAMAHQLTEVCRAGP